MKTTINATRVIPRRIMCLALSLVAMAALALRSQAAQDKQVPFNAAFTMYLWARGISQSTKSRSSVRAKRRLWARPQQLLLTSLSISDRKVDCDLHIWRGQWGHCCSGGEVSVHF